MKIFKQLICFILAVAMLAAVGCGGGSPADTGAEPTDTEAVKRDGTPVGSLTVGGVDISKYTVVYKSDGDATFKRALNDLVSYIEKAAGVTLKKVQEGEKAAHEICIGETDRDTERVKTERAGLVNNGYLIIYDEGRLYISGADNAGTMYGVYSFLEDFVGCRFYTSDCEAIKSAEHIDIPSDTCVTFSPKFVFRDAFWACAFDSAYSAKQKINSPYCRRLEGYGEAYSLPNGLAHTFSTLAGTDKGKQPCLTNERTFKLVLSSVKKLLKENPDAKIISVSQNDNENCCTCENCKKLDDAEGSPMGSLLTFVNRIADAIKDEYPDVYIETLAYWYTVKPPKTVKPADNVIICFAPIKSCWSHPLNDCAGKAEGRYLKSWSKICKNIFVWDYTADFSYYLNPFPDFVTLYKNVKYYIECGVTGVFSQGVSACASGEFGELRAYLTAKLLWDPDMSVERYYEYMDDFLEGYYGSGWQNIRKYIDITCETAANNHMPVNSLVNTILDLNGKKKSEKDEYLNTLRELWDKALDAADEEHYKHVEKSSIQMLHAELFCSQKPDAEKARSLLKLLKKYKITNLSEAIAVPSNPDFSKSIQTWYGN